MQACGSSDSSKHPRYTAGSGGEAGEAGTSNPTGGVAGTSGSANHAGSAGVAGGSAGAAAGPGEAGAAGTGGTTGNAGAPGTAGEAGAAGQSGLTCPAGFAECDGNPAVSCEQSLNDVKNCGACGHVCQQQNGTVTCTAEACKVTSCTSNFADCDSDPDNGCEASLASNTNCGTCGRDCTIDGATCSSGLCGTVQLFSATDMPFGADNSGARSWAFDAASATAYWVGFNSYSVRAYPFDGSAARLIWQPATAATAGIESIAVTGGNVYWSVGGSPATVFQKSVSAAAGVLPTQAFHPVARASFFRVLGSSFYWVTGDYQDPSAPANGYIYTRAISAPATDPGTAIVTVDQGNFGDFKAFEPTTNALYWISDKGAVPYEIRTTPLTGGTPTAIPKIAGAASTVVAAYGGILPTFYAAGSTLYFTRNLATSTLNGIYRFATGDTAPTQLVISEGVTSFVTDSASIYFVTQNSNQVFKAPLAGGAATPITNATGYKLIGQDSKYLYLLQAGSGTSTLAKVIK